MSDTDTARSKPQSIIDTHRAVLDLARREALVVTVEQDGQEPIRAIVRELRDRDDFAILCPDSLGGTTFRSFMRIKHVKIANIDRLTLHA